MRLNYRYFFVLVGLVLAITSAGCGEASKAPDGANASAPEPLPFEPAGPNTAPDPARPGPYPVGVRTITFEDPTRANKDGTPRRLVTEIWYPAVEAARDGVGATYDLSDLMTDEQRARFAEGEVRKNETFAVRDAPPRRDEPPFPLVIFSHGNGGIRWQSTYYTVVLASHGYVVAAPDHEGNTLADALRDELRSFLEGFEQRPLDVRFLIDTLPSHELFGDQIDAERIGVTGHSFGAFTSLRSAALDDRIDAVVPQAPPNADLIFAGLPQPVRLEIPVLLQLGVADLTLPHPENGAPTWAALDRPRYLLELIHGGHYTFSDLCRLEAASLADNVGFFDAAKILDDGCGEAAPPPEIAYPLINHFAIAFFNAELRGSVPARKQLTAAAAASFGEDIARFVADP